MTKHWHVASGITGYGPVGADGYGTATNPESLADMIADQLRDWEEFESEGANGYAESGDYESAWRLLKHSETLDTLAANLDNKRANAPIYRDNRPAWHETILRTVADSFPCDVNEGRSRVYVWECDTADCEHLAELDD